MPSQRQRRGCLPIVLGVIGLIAFGTVAGLYESDHSKPTTPALTDRERAEGAALYVGQRAVRARLKDPSSAVFSEGFGRTVGGLHVACGMVNAKNSFGALAGAEPWLIIVERETVLIRSPRNGAEFAKLWNRYCAGPADK